MTYEELGKGSNVPHKSRLCPREGRCMLLEGEQSTSGRPLCYISFETASQTTRLPITQGQSPSSQPPSIPSPYLHAQSPLFRKSYCDGHLLAVSTLMLLVVLVLLCRFLNGSITSRTRKCVPLHSSPFVRLLVTCFNRTLDVCCGAVPAAQHMW